MDDGGSVTADDGTSFASLLGAAGSSIGAGAAESVLDQANSAIPDLSYSAGSNATQGALDTLSPYLPYLVVGGLLLMLALAASGR